MDYPRQAPLASRRQVLRGTLATGAAVLVGSQVVDMAPSAAATKAKPQQFYDVRTFGAVGNGSTDDTSAFLLAINRASAAGGGIVSIPAGTYLISSALSLPDGVSLEGVGWHSPRAADSQDFNGSWIFVTQTGFSPLTLSSAMSGRGAAVRCLGFYYPSESPTSPIAYGPTISLTNVDDVTLEDLHFYNSYDAVIVQNCGRIKADRISGQPLHIGMQFDQVHDTLYINNVHFWPFWAQTSSLGYLQWSVDNGKAFVFLDVDNPLFSNIFALGYLAGCTFGASGSGSTSKSHLQNADLDGNQYGIAISGNNTTGQMSNVTIQGPDNIGYNGIDITGGGCVIHCANLRISAVQDNAIRIDSGGTNSQLVIHGFWADNWNLSHAGFPAIEIVNGNTSAACSLGVGNFFQGGNGAPFFSSTAASQIQLAQTSASG